MFGGRSDVAPDQVAAYIRWSTDEQSHGTTLAVQRERVEWFIRSQGWELREELVFIDDGYSGGTLDRPGLHRLRQAIREGVVRCVVVYRLDRLSRSLLDTVNLVRREWEGRAVLCSATENFDTQSPAGQMIFNMLASFAEFERSLIRERTSSGKRKRAEQGRNAGQRYPIGYRKGVDGGWSLDGVDPVTGQLTGGAALVRSIFDRFLSGMGTGAIARLLNAEGFPTPTGVPWRFHYVARILRNPIYAGRYRYGRTAATQVTGAIPAIVSEAEFEQAQQMLRGRKGGRSAPAVYLLTGVARCGRCGSPMAGSRGRSRRYYVCTGRTLLHRCDCGYIDAGEVEAAVLAEVRRHLPDTPRPQAMARRRKEALRLQEAQVRELESARAALARQRRRVEEAFLEGRLAAPDYTRLAGRLGAELTGVEARLREAAALSTLLAEERMDAGAVDPWPHLQPEQVRQVVRLVTAELTLYRPPSGRTSRSAPPEVEVAWRPRTDRVPPEGGADPRKDLHPRASRSTL